ncbi:MAG: hypothetical protein DSY42_05605 [Aquifex sp.]|nr:MAG: hypothetical protein DSY42_05605 [Aquifex sp.]
MPILDELAKLVQDELVKGVIKTIVDTDEIFNLIPFRKVTGGGLTVTWEKTIPQAVFIAPDGTVPQSTGGTLTQFTETVKVIARDIDIPNYAIEVMESDPAVMIEAEIKAMARLYKKTMWQGDTVQDANAFDGLVKKLTQVENLGIRRSVDAGANPIDFKMLDELLALMKTGVDAIVMHPRAYIAFKDLLRRTAGGTTAHMLQLKNFGKPVLTYDGIPILQSEYIPLNVDTTNNVTTTYIFALRFGEADGVTGLYGGSSAGIEYKELGEVSDKDAKRFRFKWYCGLTVMSPYAIGAIKNVKV